MNVQHIRYVARESLHLDMNQRQVKQTHTLPNFLGYEINDDGYLKSNTYYGCHSDWPALLRYARKIDVEIHFVNDEAKVLCDGAYLDNEKLQKRLLKHTIKYHIRKARSLSLQGNFIDVQNIQVKASHSIWFNWKVMDVLVKFTLKARLNILPVNFITNIWHCENSPRCFLCNHQTESVAHVVNSCAEFKNFYSRRHNRVVEIVRNFVKECQPRTPVYMDKLAESIFPNLRERLLGVNHRKPDIISVDCILKRCIIVEVTVCYDLYFEYASNGKIDRYKQLVDILTEAEYDVKLIVLCFGSLGCVHKNVYKGLRQFTRDKIAIKELMQQCSISCIIGSNYIWRHRVKKLAILGYI